MKKIVLIIVLIILILTTSELLISNFNQNKNMNIGTIKPSEVKQTILKDKGIFSEYYEEAEELLKTMTLDEKIGQLFLVRYPSENQINILNKYNFGGYLFFEKDFKGKTKSQVQEMINNVQEASKIPLITAVDEEGGTVVRISSNANLAKSKFKSPMQLYKLGGFEKIEEDVKEKSEVLSDLGINLNLAPVVDVSTNPNDFMYDRTLGEDATLTSIYAKTVINASKNLKVSYTLKHFPGYGNNIDTHTSTSVDKRTYESILENDMPPFKAGIEAGAEAILVSHNVVTCIDKENPASLSPAIHKLLKDDLSFTGIIITDDLAMAAVSSDEDATVKAVLAGNNLMITTNYKQSINSVKNAIEEEILTEEKIDELVERILAWKYYKKLI